jgi:hypothetical protein
MCNIEHIVSLCDWVSFWKEYYLCNRVSRGRNTHFFPNRPIHLNCRMTSISNREPSTLETGASSTLSPCENWGNFGNKYCLSIRDSKGDKHSFFPNKSIHLSWINTCIFQKKASMWEGGPSSTLFPCENCASFWAEYYLPIRVFKGEKHWLVQKRPVQVNWRNTGISQKKTI